ncbi:DUF1016 N-terminal domain-containing protein [Aliarcobacter skirrowii]|uniref:DUF1016 N-terminal domain-containing protein n=1 Tax=Aliarcobacter skirrowii TaxID=28200 RepID=UPI0029B3501A|nr:DUF1016 N-terminal domain-containing protein [Aliarcobacter skirrowii]MDX4036416.1 DUF1016 N-terminal domain-containing protein [Aliarcobacter skirrowii]
MSNITNNSLFEQIKNLIEQTKNNVAISVNSSLTMMYWEIGNRINQNILKNQRAEYGKEIVATVSQQLIKQYGKGYSYSALTRMMKFANTIEKQKVVTLSRQLSWSHFLALLPLQDNLKIEFYAQMTIAQNWGVRILRERIDSMLYERTALSKQPDELIKYELNNIKQEEFSKNMILKDPYYLGYFL